jgi:hypothetical protein
METIRRKHSIASRAPERLGQQALALIVANCLEIYSGEPCELSDF